MKENFETAVQYVLHDEGGYAERSNEPGGAGNHGISFVLFSDVWNKDAYFRETFYPDKKDLVLPTWPEVRDGYDYPELKALTDAGASYIYQKYVFPTIKFDDLPTGLDYAMATLATMQGPTGAVRLLQQDLGVPVTGKLDAATMEALNKAPTIPAPVAGVLIQQANAKMHDRNVGPHIDPQSGKEEWFGPGWGNRMVRTWNRILGMMK